MIVLSSHAFNELAHRDFFLAQYKEIYIHMMEPASSSGQPPAMLIRRRLVGKQPPLVRRRLTFKQPRPAAYGEEQPEPPIVRVSHHSDSYYTKHIELYWKNRGPTVPQVLRMDWFETQHLVHKHIVDLAESGLPFQIKLKMVWLIDIPTNNIFNQLNAINMVPFRVMPGAPAQNVPSTTAGMTRIIRQNIRDKLEQFTQLEESGWVFKRLKVMEVLTKPEGELVVPWAGQSLRSAKRTSNFLRACSPNTAS